MIRLASAASRAAACRPARAGLAVAVLAAVTLAAPASQALAKAPRAQVESCRRLKGSAKRACDVRNAANRTVLKKLLDSELIGVRGDGAEVDWTFCATGRFVLGTTSGGSTGVSRGMTWQVENARVRQGGRWFDAIVTAPGGLAVAVAMRGGRWQVGIESFDEVSQLGPVTRTSAKVACATD
ncbi:hypothetical protein [Conexibacter sp. CPCC 206217]|uniref:hypothetical protein n=1 Tax=Conexibacter sp. CPCC 206217 TaxID=3064574 RepID=UPI00271CF604|nr:hypothetical protein [Conexibacter sp. CPCC 206217]MDO8212293.1 hypothetical protein [Conexibacter sp. CPCC 206217]